MDTERRVNQLDADVHEIYELLRGLNESVDGLKRSGNEQWGMIKRQGNRLDSLEAKVAQLADDVTEVRGDVGEIKAAVVGLDAKMDRVLGLVESFVTGFNDESVEE